MAVLANVVFPSFPRFHPIKLSENQSCLCINKGSLQISTAQKTRPNCSMRASMAELGYPNNMKIQMGIAREKLCEVVPESAKDFPWKEAGTLLVEKLLLLGKKTLKGLLILFFISSFVSDVIFSLSRNRELMIPIGLFVGSLVSDFLNETAEEILPGSETNGFKKQLIGISCFFVLVKLLSSYFSVSARVLLLQTANGGLMQALWLWRPFREDKEEKEKEKVEHVA